MSEKNTGYKLAWHYTTGEHFIKIAEDGYLDPKRTVTPADERPILWFSVADHWEPTAGKGLSNGTSIPETQDMMGTYQHGRGLVRFGVPRSRLVAWPKVGRKAGMSAVTIRSLESAGGKAAPRDWFGTFKPVRVKDCVVEVFDPPQWVCVRPKDN